MSVESDYSETGKTYFSSYNNARENLTQAHKQDLVTLDKLTEENKDMFEYIDSAHGEKGVIALRMGILANIMCRNAGANDVQGTVNKPTDQPS